MQELGYPDDKKNVRREMGWEYGKYCCPIYEGDLDFARIVKNPGAKPGIARPVRRKRRWAGFPKTSADILRREIALLKKLALAQRSSPALVPARLAEGQSACLGMGLLDSPSIMANATSSWSHLIRLSLPSRCWSGIFWPSQMEPGSAAVVLAVVRA